VGPWKAARATIRSPASDYYYGDTYFFNLGDGKDSIYDYGYPGSLDSAYNDTLQFGAGISASGVTLLHSGNDMVFRVGATDQVTVKDWFSSYYYYIEQVQFADGTQWSPDTLRAMVVLIQGTARCRHAHRLGRQGLDQRRGRK
jgi:hypothetical protein